MKCFQGHTRRWDERGDRPGRYFRGSVIDKNNEYKLKDILIGIVCLSYKSKLDSNWLLFNESKGLFLFCFPFKNKNISTPSIQLIVPVKGWRKRLIQNFNKFKFVKNNIQTSIKQSKLDNSLKKIIGKIIWLWRRYWQIYNFPNKKIKIKYFMHFIFNCTRKFTIFIILNFKTDFVCHNK